MNYRQSTLEKRISNESVLVTVTFLPTKYARRGAVVKLRADDGQWDDGWLVRTVGEEVHEENLPNAHRGIKNHRQNSGDALPRRSKKN